MIRGSATKLLPPKRVMEWVSLLAVIAVLMSDFEPISAQAKTPEQVQGTGNCRYFPDTGHAVCGRFLEYWTTHGGLNQQGYPLSDPLEQKSDTNGRVYVMQYFERAVFEYHPENQPPNDVLLSLLGNFFYKAKYPSGAPNQQASTQDTTRYEQTGHSLGGIFRQYWETHGGLPQQGYPISDEFQERSNLDRKVYTVQYFERAVFELHPENQPPYNVLLSQLGTFQYQPKNQPFEDVARLIKANGKVDAGLRSRYMGASAQGQGKSIRQLPAVMLSGNTPKLRPNPCSEVTVIGDAPEGFAHQFDWCREDQHAFLVAFINAADQDGLAITGLQPGDIVTITSASGIAYFSKDTGNPFARNLVGLIAAGADAGSSILGYPEAVPLIDKAEQEVKELFKGTGEPTKPRNAFGVEPPTGGKAEQEGGILICLPEAGGPLYSGDDDHKERWIKHPGDRVDENRPAHFKGHAFFPIQGDVAHNTRVITQAGVAFVLPWDFAFRDNSGYYKVFIYISKGAPPTPEPIP